MGTNFYLGFFCPRGNTKELALRNSLRTTRYTGNFDQSMVASRGVSALIRDCKNSSTWRRSRLTGGTLSTFACTEQSAHSKDHLVLYSALVRTVLMLRSSTFRFLLFFPVGLRTVSSESGHSCKVLDETGSPTEWHVFFSNCMNLESTTAVDCLKVTWMQDTSIHPPIISQL